MKLFSKKIAATFVVLSAFGLSLQIHAANPKEIRISLSGAGEGGKPKLGGFSIATAQARGVLEQEFQKDGIKIKWLFFPGAGPATNEALANGKLDFAFQGDLPSLVGRATGLKTRVLFSTGRFGPVYVAVPADSRAKSFADLKGKKFSIFKGTNQQIVFNRLLAKYGFTERDLRVISQDGFSARTALATGDIDAAITSPFSLVSRGVAKTLLEIKDPKVSALTHFWVTESFEKQYPEITQRVVTTLIKQAQWSSEEANRVTQYKLWAQSGIPLVDYQKTWDGWNLKDRNSPLLDEFHRSQIDSALQIAKDAKLIRRDVDTKTWYEPKYLNHALKELSLQNYWRAFNANGQPK